MDWQQLLIVPLVSFVASIVDALIKTKPDSMLGQILSLFAINLGAAKNDPGSNV